MVQRKHIQCRVRHFGAPETQSLGLFILDIWSVLLPCITMYSLCTLLVYNKLMGTWVGTACVDGQLRVLTPFTAERTVTS
jgi:hypothetical protein